MKFALCTAALLAASASGFAPAQQGSRSATLLNAEMSKSLPFMKKPALVSRGRVPCCSDGYYKDMRFDTI